MYQKANFYMENRRFFSCVLNPKDFGTVKNCLGYLRQMFKTKKDEIIQVSLSRPPVALYHCVRLTPRC